MKKISTYIIITCSVLFISTFYAQDFAVNALTQIYSSVTTPPSHTFSIYEKGSSCQFLDIFLNDTLEDVSDSVKRKIVSLKDTMISFTSTFRNFFLVIALQGVLYNKLYIPTYTSLFVLVCVFRI